MFVRSIRGALVALCVAAVPAAGLAAVAAHREYQTSRCHCMKRPCEKVDIERASGKLCGGTDGWDVTLFYEVEFKHLDPEGRFDLVLRFMRHGREVSDAMNEPITVVIPLKDPIKNDDDDDDGDDDGKVEFKGCIGATIPYASLKRTDDLRVQARVIDRQKGHVRALKSSALCLKK